MAQRRVLLLAACLVCVAAFANGCIYKFGSSPDSLVRLLPWTVGCKVLLLARRANNSHSQQYAT